MPTQLCDNHKLIFTIVFLILLPANPGSGSGSRDPIGPRGEAFLLAAEEEEGGDAGEARRCEAEELGDTG